MSLKRKMKRKKQQKITKKQRQEFSKLRQLATIAEMDLIESQENIYVEELYIDGKYTDATVYTEDIEDKAKSQIQDLVDLKIFEDSVIKVMPDVHYGKGAPIGLTVHKPPFIPNLFGVDLYCGVSMIEIGKVENYDLEKVFNIIQKEIPTGFSTHQKPVVDFPRLKDLKCYNHLENLDRIEKSIGTLGGGNHYIEIGKDDNDNLFASVHSGSRNLGHQVAIYYQKLAEKDIETINNSKEEDIKKEIERKIEELKAMGKESDIEKEIKEIKEKYSSLTINKDLAHLSKDEDINNYIHDMEICGEYASLSRAYMLKVIAKAFDKDYESLQDYECVHNYYDKDNDILRKGAVSALTNDIVLIPISMKEGTIFGVGKGNGFWNLSAPHGAGRLMGRNESKEKVSLEEFKSEMEGIVSNASEATLDEAPQCYRSLEDIEKRVEPTVDIVKIIRPILNYKG